MLGAPELDLGVTGFNRTVDLGAVADSGLGGGGGVDHAPHRLAEELLDRLGVVGVPLNGGERLDASLQGHDVILEGLALFEVVGGEVVPLVEHVLPLALFGEQLVNQLLVGRGVRH